MIYLQLFIIFAKVGLFSIGGGYASLPLIQQEVIYNYGFITVEQFTDILTISQMTPGPIAINTATFVGTMSAGFLGSVCATLGYILPSFIIIIIFSYFFFRYNNLTFVSNVLTYLKPAIVGIISCVAVDIFANAIIMSISPIQLDFKGFGIFIVCFYLLTKKNFSIMKIIPISALLGIILYL